MKRKNQFSTSNKYWLLILAIICIVLMGLSGFAESGKGPLSWAAGYTIVPMQKGINRVGCGSAMFQRILQHFRK